MGSAPLEQRIMVMAMTAADDCTHMVSTLPMSRKMRVVEKLAGSKEEKKLSNTGCSPRRMASPVSRNVPSPSKRKARPKRKPPTFSCRLR